MDREPHDLSWWRGRILHSALVAVAVLGTVAYIPSVVLSFRFELWSIVAIDTLALAGAYVLLFAKRLSYEARAIGASAIIYLLAAVLIAVLGMTGAGLVWLAAFPLFTAILLGLRPAVASIGLSTATCTVFGVLLAMGRWHWAAFQTPLADELATWVVDAANTLVVSGAASLAMATLLHGLEHANHSLIQAIEARDQSESERQGLEAQLRQAQKLEAVGRLAGGIAHDFNNLLVPMLVYTEEVRHTLDADSIEYQRLGEVLTSAERARSLVQRILLFSRRTVVARTAVRLDAIVREAGSLLRAAVPPMVEIRYLFESSHAVVIADAAEMHQVIMNLGTNAAYAMRGRSGHLTFQIDEQDREGIPLVRLRVSDTGSGMDTATMERAFEPFFTTKPPGEGSGLGLAAVHGIVAELNGEISLSSTPGVGTTVEIVLPRKVEQPLEPAELGASLAEAGVSRGSRQRVLVVDDEPSVLAACQQLLDRLNYEVVACSHPAQALELLREQPSAVDVLLTDQAMPHMTGPALAEAARQLRPDLPVVLATGFLDDAVRHAVEAVGIDQVLHKPYTVTDLSIALRTALEARSRA